MFDVSIAASASVPQPGDMWVVDFGDRRLDGGFGKRRPAIVLAHHLEHNGRTVTIVVPMSSNSDYDDIGAVFVPRTARNRLKKCGWAKTLHQCPIEGGLVVYRIGPLEASVFEEVRKAVASVTGLASLSTVSAA